MAKYLQLLVLFTLLIFIINAQAGVKCPKNQIINRCGTACPPKCNDEGPKACTKQCVFGCQCKKGYLLNAQLECVKREHC